jgi:hypothetical protein
LAGGTHDPYDPLNGHRAHLGLQDQRLAGADFGKGRRRATDEFTLSKIPAQPCDTRRTVIAQPICYTLTGNDGKVGANRHLASHEWS